MNGNNWQRIGQFVRPPRHDLSPVSQLPAGELFPVGQLMEGGGMPAPAMMPQEQMPRQQDYGEGRPPTGKKILGMPKDRFIALMGTIAQAFGGDSASGRMGAGLVNMADIMHGERMAQGERQATEAEARRKAAAELAKEKRTTAAKIATEKRGVTTTIAKEKRGAATTIAKEGRGTAATIAKEKRKTAAMVAKEKRAAEREIPSGWEATYKSMWGKIDPDTKRPYTIEKIRTVYGKTETKPPTYAEKRARVKAAKESEAIILNPEYQSAEYQNELQMEIDNFDRYSDKPYTYQMTPGRVVDWGRDIPSKLEKVDISTPEKIRDSDLPVEIKLKLLKTRFGFD